MSVVIHVGFLTDQYFNVMHHDREGFCTILPQFRSRKHSGFKSFQDLLVHSCPLTPGPRPALGDSADFIIHWLLWGERHDEIFTCRNTTFFCIPVFSLVNFGYLDEGRFVESLVFIHSFIYLFVFVHFWFCSVLDKIKQSKE